MQLQINVEISNDLQGSKAEVVKVLEEIIVNVKGIKSENDSASYSTPCGNVLIYAIEY